MKGCKCRILLQYLGFSGLWVAKVHHLIKQLVDDHEVVPYALLFELLEVFCKDFYDLVEEQENLSSIAVPFGKGEEVKVVVADVEVVDAFAGEAWWDRRALVFGFAQ